MDRQKIQNNQERKLLRQFLWSSVLFIIPMLIVLVLANNISGDRAALVEQQALLAIYQNSSPVLDRFFLTVTHLGDAIVLIPLTAALIAWLYATRRRLQALFVTFAIGGTAAINIIMKALFSRDRPELWEQLIVEQGYSFPSGHAMITSTVAFLAITLLWPTAYRLPALILGSLYFLTVSFSRLYLGVHYPSDIVAGWCVSLLWIALLASIFNRYRRSGAVHNQKELSKDSES